MERHNQIANAQVVFVDVEAYSKRRTQNQIEVIKRFTEDLEACLTAVSQTFVSYAQENGINFKNDLIRLPTGDGIAIGFTFNGLHDIHLQFALGMLKAAATMRDASPCERFEAEGWCNCHPYYNLRVGIAEGKVIVYRDVNGNYNLAGGVVNMASRVMGKVGRNQIAFTKSAYEQIVDLANDPNLADRFRPYEGIRIKHNVRISLYQYWDAEAVGLDSDPVHDLVIASETDAIFRDLLGAGSLGVPGLELGPDIEPAQILQVAKNLEFMFAMMKSMPRPEGGSGGSGFPPSDVMQRLLQSDLTNPVVRDEPEGDAQ